MIVNRIKIFSIIILVSFIVIDLFLYIPNSWQNFFSGLFYTTGAAVPFLILLYVFYYIPKLKFYRQMIPRTKKIIEESNLRLQDYNNTLDKLMGSHNVLDCLFKRPEVFKDNSLDSLIKNTFTLINNERISIEKYESDLRKFERFSLGTFIFDIFNKKFF